MSVQRVIMSRFSLNSRPRPAASAGMLPLIRRGVKPRGLKGGRGGIFVANSGIESGLLRQFQIRRQIVGGCHEKSHCP